MIELPVDVSVVIACYNEESVLVKNVREIMDILDQTTYRYEVILADDGSTDSTVTLIEGLAEQYPCISYLIHPVNMGRGRTVADGIRKARGRVVGFIDIDLQTPAHYLPRLIREVERGADVAIAKRVYKLSPSALGRWILSKGYMVLSSLVLGVKRRDTESGCKFFRREAILPVIDEAQDPHWFWDTEVMALGVIRGLRIQEVSTLFVREVSDRSTVKIVRDVLHYGVNLFRFRRRMGAALHATDSRKKLYARYRGSQWGWLYYRLRWAICPFRMMELFLPEQGTIIDVGCGEGVLATYVALVSQDRTVVGIDLDQRRVAVAQTAADGVSNLRFLHGRLEEHIPRTVDGIVMSDFLHHVPLEEQRTLLRLSFEHLTDGGVLLIKEVNRGLSLQYGLSWLADKILYGREPVFHRRQEDLCTDLRAAGFCVRVHKRPNLLSTYLFLCQKTDDVSRPNPAP